MKREEILNDPEVAHYCDAKRGWVHEAFLDGVDYAERKLGSTIHWQTGEPTEGGRYLITPKGAEVVSTATFIPGDANDKHFFKEYVTAWCKLSDIEPYRNEMLQM